MPTGTVLFALLALYALYMLVRYAPRALKLAREQGNRAGLVVPLVNVLLAVAILAVAVKGLVGALISR